MGSTDRPTNAWIQLLGIIGTFDDDRSLWTRRALTLSFYHFTPGNLDTPRHPPSTREKKPRPQWRSEGKWRAPSEPNRTPNFPRQR